MKTGGSGLSSFEKMKTKKVSNLLKNSGSWSLYSVLSTRPYHLQKLSMDIWLAATVNEYSWREQEQAETMKKETPPQRKQSNQPWNVLGCSVSILCKSWRGFGNASSQNLAHIQLLRQTAQSSSDTWCHSCWFQKKQLCMPLLWKTLPAPPKSALVQPCDPGLLIPANNLS